MRTSSEESDVEYELCRRVSNKQPTPHSIADILGWSRDCQPVLSHHRHQCPGEMADCATDLESVVNDEPLDLSLHKSKCSDDEQSLQMAANFSTVLQYYLAATRLWQSEVIRYNNESRPESSAELASSDDNRPLTESRPENSPAATTAAAATTATIVTPPLSKSAKRRKKELESQAADGTSRPRKTRTTFTGKQLFELERIFEQKKYLSSNERQEVARLLNVTGSQIKIWFQNRRTKWKKQDPTTAAELAQMKSASRVTKSKPGSDRSQQDAAAISASENSDAATNASSPPPSPSQT